MKNIKSNELKLSIIIPTYNTKLLDFMRCIKSVENINKCLEYEVIIIDDGSSKANSQKYRDFLKNYTNILYKKTENLGVSNARNLGIKLSKGEYILFVDADDILYADKIKEEYLTMNKDFILFDMIIKNKEENRIVEFGKKSGELNLKNLFESNFKNNNLNHPVARLYKADFLKNKQILFNLNVLENKPKIYYIKQILYCYYQEFNNGFERVIKNPEKVSNNIYGIYLERKKIINSLYNEKNRKKYEKKLNIDYINSIYNIMKAVKRNAKIKKNYLRQLEYIKIDIMKLDIKTFLKYLILLTIKKRIEVEDEKKNRNNHVM